MVVLVLKGYRVLALAEAPPLRFCARSVCLKQELSLFAIGTWTTAYLVDIGVVAHRDLSACSARPIDRVSGQENGMVKEALPKQGTARAGGPGRFGEVARAGGGLWERERCMEQGVWKLGLECGNLPLSMAGDACHSHRLHTCCSMLYIIEGSPSIASSQEAQPCHKPQVRGPVTL